MSIIMLGRPVPSSPDPGFCKCGSELRSDGSCGPCAFLAFRGPAAYLDALDRIEGHCPTPARYTARYQDCDLATVLAYRSRLN